MKLSWRQDKTKLAQSYNTRTRLINYKFKNLFETQSFAPACWKTETRPRLKPLYFIILYWLSWLPLIFDMVEKARKDQTKPNLKEHETIQTILFQMRWRWTAIVGPIKIQVYAYYDVSFKGSDYVKMSLISKKWLKILYGGSAIPIHPKTYHTIF